jgi:hypothetical protein
LKKYITEIETLDQQFSGQLQKIEKAAALINTFGGGKELTKADLPSAQPEKPGSGS